MKEVFEFQVRKERFELLVRALPWLVNPVARRTEWAITVQFIDSRERAREFYELHRSMFGEAPEFPYVKRVYSPDELRNADLLRLYVWSLTEIAGREFGTTYDDSSACRACGTGAKQVGDLILDTSALPPQDITMTLAGEIVVSNRFRQLSAKANFTGIRFGPVVSHRTGRASRTRAQLFVEGVVQVAPQTKFGVDAFDEDLEGKYRCAKCGLLGARILSELYVARETWDGSDFAISSGRVGTKLGLYEPWPILVISGRAYSLLTSNKISGFGVEVAHFV